MIEELNNDDFRGDEVDISSGIALAFEKQALETARAKSNIRNHPRYSEFDGEHCVECGEEIEPARLALQVSIFCVQCQEDIERKSKLFAGG
jgi:hypothetical protein